MDNRRVAAQGQRIAIRAHQVVRIASDALRTDTEPAQDIERDTEAPERQGKQWLRVVFRFVYI